MKDSFWRTLSVLRSLGRADGPSVYDVARFEGMWMRAASMRRSYGPSVYDVARFEGAPVTSVWYRLNRLVEVGYVRRVDAGQRGNVAATFRYECTPSGVRALHARDEDGQYHLFIMAKSGWRRERSGRDYAALLAEAEAQKRPYALRTSNHWGRGETLADRGWERATS